MKCNLRREKQLLLAGLAGLEGGTCPVGRSSAPFLDVQGLQRVLVAGTGDCQRHLLAVRICQWVWLCPVFAVASSSEVSHLELAALRVSDRSPAHSSDVLAVLPPHRKSSNWLFGSLYTKFKLLALTS